GGNDAAPAPRVGPGSAAHHGARKSAMLRRARDDIKRFGSNGHRCSMAELLGIAPSQLFGQLLLGLINGACYAMLSIGLAIIFGLLNIINFTHGAQYMMGAFCAWMLLTFAGIGYWPALIIAPIVIGLSGLVLERLFLKRIYKLDHIYGFLLTFGLSLIIEGIFRQRFGSSGQPYSIPAELQGGIELGFVF